MKLAIIGLWAVLVTVGAGYGMAITRLDAPKDGGPSIEGLRYTSLPTMSVPVVEGGRVNGYVVVRMVYTADAGMLRSLATPPDPFLSDEVFRNLYARAETRFGALKRIDIDDFSETVRSRVNERLGAEVVEDLLVDGLNYVDLSDPAAAEAANSLAEGAAMREPASVRPATPRGSAAPSSAKPQLP